MGKVDPAEETARLAWLVDRAEPDDISDITRGGGPVAQVTAAATPRKRIDSNGLLDLTETLPASRECAADLVRLMRDGDRY